MLYNKWWGKDEVPMFCPKHVTDITKASALNLINIGGVFVVLLAGLAIAVAVTFKIIIIIGYLFELFLPVCLDCLVGVGFQQ